MPKNVRIAAVLGLLCVAAPVGACSVPVFRYALDRWAADPLPVTVFHRDSLTPEQERLVTRLRKPAHANVEIRLVDVSKPLDERTQRLWQTQTKFPLPRLVLDYADGRPNDEPAWSAPLDKDSIAALLDSPARQIIGRRILEGQSAVFVL